MPLLARARHRVGQALADQLVLADAAVTKACVLLRLSTLIGLGLYAVTGLAWPDPVAGSVNAAFVVHEGREAWEGELVDIDDDDVQDRPRASSIPTGDASGSAPVTRARTLSCAT